MRLFYHTRRAAGSGLAKNSAFGYTGPSNPAKNMAKQCIITGKKVSVGNNVSHSNQKTKRRLFPNLIKRRLLNPATGRTVTVQISNRGMRTLKKWKSEGKKYNLATLSQEAMR